MWIKICGTTNVEDALLASEAGADAVGFVFAESPRKVNTGVVRPIVDSLPLEIEKIGVFVDASADEIAEIARECGLTGVQLHSGIADDAVKRLRSEFGAGLKILRVLHYGAEIEESLRLAAETAVDGVLVDSRTAAAVGGTGVRFDWEEARRTIFGGERKMKLIAAGGLNAENVGEAICVLKPWGVDVVTGVECAPGRKDPEKVKKFIEAVRAAH
jgi:phosphoribosylanthranilate isomerase